MQHYNACQFLAEANFDWNLGGTEKSSRYLQVLSQRGGGWVGWVKQWETVSVERGCKGCNVSSLLCLLNSLRCESVPWGFINTNGFRILLHLMSCEWDPSLLKQVQLHSIKGHTGLDGGLWDYCQTPHYCSRLSRQWTRASLLLHLSVKCAISLSNGDS